MKTSTKLTLAVLLGMLLLVIIAANIIAPSSYLVSIDLGSYTKWTGEESFGDQPTYAFCVYKEGLYNLVLQNVYDFDNFNIILRPEYFNCPIG